MIDRLVRRAFALFVVAGILALAGCATTAGDSPALFVLDSGSTAADTTPKPDAPTLVVAPVATAAYLNQGGLVYQTGPHQIAIANDNRWASPLAGQLTDALYAPLDRRLSGVNVTRAGGNRQKSYQLRTRVDQFRGQYDGNAHIAGRWTLLGPDGNTVAGHAFATTVPLATHGYPALVNSLSKGWQNVVRRMSPALQRALPPPDQGS